MNIYKELEKSLKSNGTVNVVIAGITCSGKTTLANNIRKYYSNEYEVAIVSQDDYFKDLPNIPRVKKGYLTDSINAFCTAEFKNDVQMLLQSGTITVPKYDVSTNTRIAKCKIVKVGKINVFEGLHTINLLRDLENSISIFINTEVWLCLRRRIERDTSKYCISETRIRQYWDDCIMPMCEQYIFPQKQFADIIINGKGGDINDD